MLHVLDNNSNKYICFIVCRSVRNFIYTKMCWICYFFLPASAGQTISLTESTSLPSPTSLPLNVSSSSPELISDEIIRHVSNECSILADSFAKTLDIVNHLCLTFIFYKRQAVQCFRRLITQSKMNLRFSLQRFSITIFYSLQILYIKLNLCVCLCVCPE